MRASSSGPLGAFLMIAPLVAIPVFAVIGIPQFAPVVASPVSEDEFPEEVGEPGETPLTPAVASVANDLFAPLSDPQSQVPAHRPAPPVALVSQPGTPQVPIRTIPGSADHQTVSGIDSYRRTPPSTQYPATQYPAETQYPAAQHPSQYPNAQYPAAAQTGRAQQPANARPALGDWEVEAQQAASRQPAMTSGQTGMLADNSGFSGQQPPGRAALTDAPQETSFNRPRMPSATSPPPRARNIRTIPDDFGASPAGFDAGNPGNTGSPSAPPFAGTAPGSQNRSPQDQLADARLPSGDAPYNNARAQTASPAARSAGTGFTDGLIHNTPDLGDAAADVAFDIPDDRQFSQPGATPRAPAGQLAMGGQPPRQSTATPRGTGVGAAAQGQVPQQVPAGMTQRFTWKMAQQRLHELGIRNYHLESLTGQGRFLFSCSVRPAESPHVIRRFEAEADEPLLAVQKVLEEIDDWRRQR